MTWASILNLLRKVWTIELMKGGTKMSVQSRVPIEICTHVDSACD